MRPTAGKARWRSLPSLLLTLLATLFVQAHQAGAQSIPASEAAELHNQGFVLYQQGRYTEAEPLFKRTLAILEKAFGREHPDVARSLNNLAVLYRLQGRLAEAEPLHKRALAIREKALGREHADVATSLNNLALLYLSQRRLVEAEPLFKRAVAISEKALGPEHPDVAMSLNNLSEIYSTQGRLAEAEPLRRRALVISEKALGREHPDVATILNSLAALYLSQGRLVDAEPLFKRALAIREKALAPGHEDVATSYNNLAMLYMDQGRLADAEPLIRRALAISEKTFGTEHAEVATILNNLANIHVKQRRLAESEPLHKRALAIRERTIGPEHADVAASLNNLAELYERLDRLAEAEPLHKRALAIWEKALGPVHFYVAKSYLALALLSFKQGRDAEALSSIRAVGAINRKRSAAIEDRASEGTGGEIRFSDDGLMLLAALAERQHSQTERAVLAAEAFEAAQLGSASSTSAAVARMAARHASGSDRLAGVVRQRQDAIDRRRNLDKMLLASVGRPPDQRDAQQEQRLRNDLGEIDKRLQGLDATLARDFPRYAEIASPAPVAVKDAQALLAPDEAMLLYRTTTDWVDMFATYLWVVRRDRMELLKLPLGRAVLERAVASARAKLDPSVFDARHTPPFDVVAGHDPYTTHDLYTTILAPALPLLQDAKHLLIIPDGALQSLPFGVLLTEKQGPDGAGSQAKWLIRKYAITTLPSVSSLRALRTFAATASDKAREPFAGFGDPTLEGRPGDRKGLKAASLYRGTIADADAVRSLDPLPETAGELRAMATALGAKGDAIWLRNRATEAQAKNADLSKYRVLAFATHGLMAGQFRDYGEPALVMTPPRVATKDNDGLLGASEVAQLKFNADWVILSACNTAAPDGTPGAEGLSGLAKAFLYAGARSLLVSHWSVESESSARLTTGAITALAKEPGIGRAEALRRSMLALMDDPKYAHPMFWAPFVVVGEGGAGR